MNSNKIDDKLLKIFQEFYHIKRILGSCSDYKQTECCRDWIISITEKWGFYFEKMSQRYYNKHYEKVITSILDELENTTNSMLQHFKEEEEKPKTFEIKGFQ